MDPPQSHDEAFEADRPGRRPPPADEERRRPRSGDYDVRRRHPQGGDDALSSIIPYRNGQALAAYYVGVFSLIPCVGLALALVAIVLGILGLNYVKKNPMAKGTGHAIAGIVLGGLVLLGHLAVLIMWFVAMGRMPAR